MERIKQHARRATTITYDRKGNVRPGPAAGHEHFGWQDGISQPGVNGLTTPFPGQQMVDPGLFVLGYLVAALIRFRCPG
jgi:hypothetical protein